MLFKCLSGFWDGSKSWWASWPEVWGRTGFFRCGLVLRHALVMRNSSHDLMGDSAQVEAGLMIALWIKHEAPAPCWSFRFEMDRWRKDTHTHTPGNEYVNRMMATSIPVSETNLTQYIIYSGIKLRHIWTLMNMNRSIFLSFETKQASVRYFVTFVVWLMCPNTFCGQHTIVILVEGVI